MSNYEPLNYLPPSYSAVMAEKEMDQWNMNIYQSMYEAQKMIKLVQLQCDVLQWKNSCYLKQLEEITTRNTEDISARLVEMNKSIEQLTKEAEKALYIKPRKRTQKKKKHKKRPCMSSLKYIENQRQIENTLNQIMQTIQDLENDHSSTTTVIHNYHHHHHYYISHLSSFIQYALYTFGTKKPLSSPSSVRYLSKTVKSKLMLFTTLLISQTFNHSYCSPRWAKYAHNIVSTWKCRSGTQCQFWLDKAQLTLFITQIICKYTPRTKKNLCMCK